MDKRNWESFVKGDVYNFLQEHNLQSISVDDGADRKGSIKVGSKGEVIVKFESKETM